jgi:hypothetical protein
MSATITRRRLAAAFAIAGLLAACATPAPPDPPPATPPPPALVLTSLAAYGTVLAAERGQREAVIQTAGGGLFTLSAGPQLRDAGALRTGARLVVEYDAGGAVRLAPPPRAADVARSGRLRATVRDIEPGGRTLVLAEADGNEVLVTLEDRPMMAFATRLRPGDEVAVRIVERPAAPAPRPAR